MPEQGALVAAGVVLVAAAEAAAVLAAVAVAAVAAAVAAETVAVAVAVAVAVLVAVAAEAAEVVAAPGWTGLVLAYYTRRHDDYRSTFRPCVRGLRGR